ncbi:FlgD immunoglobulin-like domain containing protein [Streptomyces sp. NPDC090025]|uniref:FlgD immunoglobulin-like domain containing protein n=1 Tax=Streptomyces sp. NPDC090025 TaxID=3365922 RepID=UPI003835E823
MTTTLGIAASLCATGAVAAVAAPAAPAAASADEAVIPDPGRSTPRADRLVQAGSTGYVHREEGASGPQWTDLATGDSRPVTTPEPLTGHSGAAAVATKTDAGTRITLTDLDTAAERSVTLPQDRVWQRAYTKDTLLTARYTGEVPEYFLLTVAADGTTAERPVTVPEGLAGVTRVLKQDARGAVLAVGTASTGLLPYFLDYASGTLTPLPERFATSSGLFLGKDHILLADPTGAKQYTLARADVTKEPVVTEVAHSVTPRRWAVVGDWLVVREPAEPYAAGGTLEAVQIGGGASKHLLPYAASDLIAAPDGSLLVVGGTGAKDWALHRISPAADGTVGPTRVRALAPAPSTYSGLVLGGGRVGYVSDTIGQGLVGQYAHDVTGPTAGPAVLRARHPAGYAPDQLRALGDGDTVAATSYGLESPIAPGSSRTAYLGEKPSVVDAAGRYVLTSDGGSLKVVDLDSHNGSPVVLTRPAAAGALWSGRLWRATGAPGKVEGYDLAAKKALPAVELNSGCAPAELQAVGRWLYWNCGPGAKAGVFDLTARTTVPVPSGEALLGDGFVVRQEGEKLRLTDLTAGGKTADLADVPAAAGSDSGRHRTWTVDRFGGGVAYVDARHDIRVKRVPVAAQPLALTDSTVDLLSGGNVRATWRTSRAVGPWTVQLTDAAGRTVRTFRGDAGKGASVAVAWDGRDDRGRGLEDGSYRFVMTASPADGAGAPVRATGSLPLSGSALTSAPGTFKPLTPARLMDTRTGQGGVPKAKVGAGRTVSLKVTGQGGVPATGVTAVVMNVTAVKPTAAGFVSVYPSGTGRTAASNLNFTAGLTVPNLVVVPVVDGKVTFYNNSGAVDLLADVAGYYTEGTDGARFRPVTPTRLMDTRNGKGVAKAKVGPGGTVTLPVTEPGARAVVLNVTATNATADSFVSVYPAGTARPAASNLNFTRGRTVPNLVVVPVKDGKVTFYNRAGTVDLIADAAGYYVDGPAVGGTRFTASQPQRVLDTRYGVGATAGKVGAGRTIALQVTGERIPADIKAVVLNVTATAPTAPSFVSVHPDGVTRTISTNLNFTTGETVPNLVVVPVVNGKVAFYNHAGSVHLVADLAGYYTD